MDQLSNKSCFASPPSSSPSARLLWGPGVINRHVYNPGDWDAVSNRRWHLTWRCSDWQGHFPAVAFFWPLEAEAWKKTAEMRYNLPDFRICWPHCCGQEININLYSHESKQYSMYNMISHHLPEPVKSGCNFAMTAMNKQILKCKWMCILALDSFCKPLVISSFDRSSECYTVAD